MPRLKPSLLGLALGASLLIFAAHPVARRGGPVLARVQAGTPGQFRSTVHTVEVQVTVRGADGQIVGGLTKDDFELLDNGKRREISVFAGDVQPIAAALVLDRSGSVAGQADQIATLAQTFIEGLLPADQASIDTLTLECQPLTADKAALRQILKGPLQGDEGSPVWSGVDNAIASLSGVSGRRAVLLFSDGDDYGPNLQVQGAAFPVRAQKDTPCRAWPDPSEASLADTSRRAAREGIMLYTVSVEGPQVSTHDADLRAVARATGGDRYRLRDQRELSAAFTRIVDELHHQYLLGFAPDVLDGKVHALTVRVKRPGVNVRARETYVALDVTPPATTTTEAPPAPAAPLSDAEVEQAIRDGSNGQRAQAACTASGTFHDRPEENQGRADVLLEGPIGRIMHAAHDARVRHDTLTAEAVTPDMRAPTVLMTVELKGASSSMGFPSGPGGMSGSPQLPSSSQPLALSAIVALRLRSPILTEYMLRPLIAAPQPAEAAPHSTSLSQHYHRTEAFDLAAFRALPGPDVEVIVRSVIGARYCTIVAKDRAAIR